MKLTDELIQDLKDKKISLYDLDDRYFVNIPKNYTESENVLQLLNNNICSFKSIVNKFKFIKVLVDDSYLYYLLREEELFKKLIQNNKLTKDDLEYLFDAIDKWYEVDRLNYYNSFLLRHLTDNDIVSFKELVDKCKNIKRTYVNTIHTDSCLHFLLENTNDFEYWIKETKLSTDDLRYLLNKTDKFKELNWLCEYNVSLLKHILSEAILDKDFVNKFNEMIKKDKWCKGNKVHNIFEYIRHHNKNNEEIVKLNDLNEKVYVLKINTFNFTGKQKLEVAKIVKNSEKAKNTLTSLIENNLQDQYDFKQLEDLLTKDDGKNLKTKFNF